MEQLASVYRYNKEYEKQANEMFERIKAAGFNPEWKEPLLIGIKRTELKAFKKYAATRKGIFGNLC